MLTTEYSLWIWCMLLLLYNFFLLSWMFEMSQAELFLEDFMLNIKLLPWPHLCARCRGYVRVRKSLSSDGAMAHHQFSSAAQLCPTLCDPMNYSTPGLPVHHQLPEFTQTHVHRVSDAIQPSHPLSSPSPPAPNSSQHQRLFQWVNSSHEVAKALEFKL